MATDSGSAAAAKPEAEKKSARAKKIAETALMKGAAEKKTPAKKTEPKTNVVIEYAGRQIVASEIVKAAIKAYKKTNRGVVVKKVDVYVKPEENAAYYVVNGEGSADYKIEL